MGKINESIKKHRINTGLTQREVADRLGISRQAYSKYENSDIVPGIERIKNLADIFRVSVKAITEEMNPQELFETAGDEFVDESFLTFARYLRENDFFVKFNENNVEISKEMTRVIFTYAEFIEFDSVLEQAAFMHIWRRRIPD